MAADREPLAAEVDRARRLADEMAAHDPIVLELHPMEALSVIGQLQLAARHPSNAGSTVAVAEAVIERIVAAYAAAGPSTHLERLVMEGARPSYDAAAPRRAIADAELVPDHIRARMAEVVDRPSPLARLFGIEVVDRPSPLARLFGIEVVDRPSPLARLFGIEVVEDESVPPGVLEVRGETTTVVRVDDRPAGDVTTVRPPAWRPPDIVRPVGLVWSGIRVDEFEGLGYTITEPGDDGPVLEPGEIYGVPLAMTIYVWSLADFRRLAELSRAMHDIRRGLRLPGHIAGEVYRPVLDLLAGDAPALEVVRAIEAVES
jgi:hypothetical protein